MKPYDWSRFTKRIPVNASTQEAYNAWTTQENLEKWFLRLAEFTKPDGTLRSRTSRVEKSDLYRWLWHGYSDEIVERGEVLQANGMDFFRFVFGKAGVVSVNIRQENEATVVELTQEDIPLDEASKVSYHLGCSEGWTFYLANLKLFLEGGIDL